MSDHNRDGQVNTDDEFIELYNPSPYPLSLDGWQLFDAGAEAGGRPYTFRSGAFINGRSWLVLYRSVSHVSLNNTNEVVSLRDPDGVEIDRITWVNNPGQGASRSRLPDGAGWQDGHATPGQANEPFSADRVEPWPTPIGSHGSQGSDQQQDDDDNNDPPPPIQLDPRHGQAGGPPASVAQSKLSGLDADVEFYAVVTAPPGLFNATIYVADPAPDPQAGPYAGIGINVYLRQAFYPTLQEGDRVRVRGVLKSFRGEMELQLADASAIQRVGTSTVLQPLPVTGAEIGETLEGRLVSLQGIVTGWQGDSIFLQDPANPTAEAVRVTVRSSTGWRRPYVNRGERWQVTGIVSQFAREAPWNGGYRILVRYPTDLVKAQ
ncbi:MAG: lamin tail domain-containing protein [Caldilineaceae bacterium]